MAGRRRPLACSRLNLMLGSRTVLMSSSLNLRPPGGRQSPMVPSSLRRAAQGHPEMLSTATGHQLGVVSGTHGCLSPGDGGGMLEALVTQAA